MNRRSILKFLGLGVPAVVLAGIADEEKLEATAERFVDVRPYSDDILEIGATGELRWTQVYTVGK